MYIHNDISPKTFRNELGILKYIKKVISPIGKFDYFFYDQQTHIQHNTLLTKRNKTKMWYVCTYIVYTLFYVNLLQHSFINELVLVSLGCFHPNKQLKNNCSKLSSTH